MYTKLTIECDFNRMKRCALLYLDRNFSLDLIEGGIGRNEASGVIDQIDVNLRAGSLCDRLERACTSAD